MTKQREANPKIVELFKQCRRVSEVATALGITEETVRKNLKLAGLMKKQSDLYQERINAIVGAWDGKESAHSLALRTGFSKSSCRRALLAAGVVTKGKRIHPSQVKDVRTCDKNEAKESRFGKMVIRFWDKMVAA